MIYLKKLGQMILMTAVAFILMLQFLFLSAPVLRISLRAYGSFLYWLIHSIIFIGLWSQGLYILAIPHVTLIVLVGVFTELSKLISSVFVAGFLAIMTSAAATVATTQQWLNLKGLTLSGLIETSITDLVKQTQQLYPQIKIEANTLIDVVPAGFVIVSIVALFFAISLDNFILRWLPTSIKLSKEKAKLHFLSYKLPDYTIWIAMFSILFSFVDFGNKELSQLAINVFYTLVVLFAVQGLAILESYMRAFKLGSLARIIIYVLAVMQMILLVSALGFVDYWMEFRGRLINRISSK